MLRPAQMNRGIEDSFKMASGGLKHSKTAAGDLVIAIRISRTVKGLCYTSYFKPSVFPAELELFTGVMNEHDKKEVNGRRKIIKY